MGEWRRVFDSVSSGQTGHGLRIDVSGFTMTSEINQLIQNHAELLMADIKEVLWKNNPQVRLKHRESIVGLKKLFDKLGNFFFQEIPNEFDKSAQYPNWLQVTTSLGKMKIGNSGSDSIYINWEEMVGDIKCGDLFSSISDHSEKWISVPISQAETVVCTVYRTIFKDQKVQSLLRHPEQIEELTKHLLDDKEGTNYGTIDIPDSLSGSE